MRELSSLTVSIPKREDHQLELLRWALLAVRCDVSIPKREDHQLEYRLVERIRPVPVVSIPKREDHQLECRGVFAPPGEAKSFNP